MIFQKGYRFLREKGYLILLSQYFSGSICYMERILQIATDIGFAAQNCKEFSY